MDYFDRACIIGLLFVIIWFGTIPSELRGDSKFGSRFLCCSERPFSIRHWTSNSCIQNMFFDTLSHLLNPRNNSSEIQIVPCYLSGSLSTLLTRTAVSRKVWELKKVVPSVLSSWVRSPSLQMVPWDLSEIILEHSVKSKPIGMITKQNKILKTNKNIS